MSHYHLYFLKQGMLIGSDKIEAADDGEAARIAREQGGGELIEIWNDHRRVRVVTPFNAEASSSDGSFREEAGLSGR